MNFTHYDLGYKSSGEIIEIHLEGNAANVRLMDSINFQYYRNGRNYKFIGGLAQSSPVRLGIPHSGNWHIAVDMQGLRGTVRTSVQTL